MKRRIIQSIPFIFVLCGIFLWCVAYYFIDTHSQSGKNFIDDYFSFFISPFYYYSLFALLPTLILIFVRKETFRAWLWFILFWIPFSIFEISQTSIYRSNAFSSDSRDNIAQATGAGFALISLGIVIWKSIALRQRTKK